MLKLRLALNTGRAGIKKERRERQGEGGEELGERREQQVTAPDGNPL